MIGELVWWLAEKFDVSPFMIQTYIVLIAFIGTFGFQAINGFGDAWWVVLIIFPVLLIIGTGLSAMAHGKSYFRKPSVQSKIDYDSWD